MPPSGGLLNPISGVGGAGAPTPTGTFDGTHVFREARLDASEARKPQWGAKLEGSCTAADLTQSRTVHTHYKAQLATTVRTTPPLPIQGQRTKTPARAFTLGRVEQVQRRWFRWYSNKPPKKAWITVSEEPSEYFGDAGSARGASFVTPCTRGSSRVARSCREQHDAKGLGAGRYPTPAIRAPTLALAESDGLPSPVLVHPRARPFVISCNHPDQQGSMQPTVPIPDLAALTCGLDNSSTTRREPG
ncbi:hypothetical protein EDB84DRAFT_1617373 [Lactarius hengduanensis]|nr:hypothetical protein EDB84DRAFT_1617373 [Lactarius hengduanensis]